MEVGKIRQEIRHRIRVALCQNQYLERYRGTLEPLTVSTCGTVLAITEVPVYANGFYPLMQRPEMRCHVVVWCFNSGVACEVWDDYVGVPGETGFRKIWSLKRGNPEPADIIRMISGCIEGRFGETNGLVPWIARMQPVGRSRKR